MTKRISLDTVNHYYSRLLQEMAFRTGGSFGKPTGVIVLLTNRCNARCVHCHSWTLESTDNEMNTVEWENTFSQLRKWLGPVFISITGGETLLRRDCVVLARHAAQLGFWVEFLTNGYLLNSEVAKKLVETGVKRIKVSLDGTKPEIHDKIRGREGFFTRALGALQMLATEKKQQKRDVKIWAKTAIMNPNVEDLPNIATLAHQIGIDGVEFQALEPIYYSEQLRDPKWYENNPLWIKDLQKLSEVIRKLKELKIQGDAIINTIENLNMIENYFSAPERFAYKVHSHDYKKKTEQCRAWVGGLQIMPDGGMKMCHWMNSFANVKDGNLKKAWKNRDRCWGRRCQYLSEI